MPSQLARNREHTIRRSETNREVQAAFGEHRDEFGRHMRELRYELENLDDPDNQRKLERLLDSITKSCVRYLEAVLSHHSAVEVLNAGSGSLRDLQQEVQRADLSRRRAHNVVMDAWRIFLRNGQRFGMDMEVLRDAGGQFFVPEDEIDGPKRSEIGKLALVHGFEQLMIAALNDPS